MGFAGFRGDFIGFFRGLEMDNTKSYFERNRARYQRDLKAPMEELLAELAPALGPGKMFRINRDIRFAADKSPYKTNLGAVAGPLYIHLDARVFFLATGAHNPDSAWLAAYRAAVDSPAGAELARIVGRLREQEMEVGGNPLKTAPRGYPADHERLELLRWREVTAARAYAIEPWIATPAVKDRILETWEDLRPFHEWLSRHVPA